MGDTTKSYTKGWLNRMDIGFFVLAIFVFAIETVFHPMYAA